MVAQDLVGGAGAVAVWQVEVVAWVAWMRAAGRAAGTIRNRSLYVRRLARWLGPRGVAPWQARTDDLAGWLAEHHWGPETRHNAVAAIRGFYDWGVRTGRVSRSPAADLGTVTVPPGLPRPVPEQVLAAALATADPRTRLMLQLAATAGLRRAEIAAVRGIDVEHDGEGPVLRVMGKGGIERLVPIGEPMARRLTMGGYGWVFPTADQEGHLSAGHVGRLMSAVLPPPWTPHALRHRFASQAYAGERDLRAVQELLGHASVSTTQRYTAVPGTAKRRAAGYAS